MAAARVPPRNRGSLAALLQLAQNVARAHRRVLHVRPGLALEAQRLLQIESDHRIARELQQEVAQRADGDLRGHALLLRRGSGVARATSSSALAISCPSGRRPSRPGPCGRRLPRTAACGLPPIAGCPGPRSSAARAPPSRREVDGLIGLRVVAQRAQPGHHHVLQVRLPRVDHVVHARAVPELLRPPAVGLVGGDPQHAAVGVGLHGR
jgi:hypothetical protein